MQSTETKRVMETKRVTVQWIGIAALALVTLMMGLVGANALYEATQDSADGPSAPFAPSALTQAAPRVAQVENRAEGPAAPFVVTQDTPRVAQMEEPIDDRQFLEWNTQLPTAAVRSQEDIRFLEMNTLLPGGVVPRVTSFAEMRFLEMNALPESAAPYYPSPTDAVDAGTPY